MTADEQALARALSRCTFPVASGPKRFARDISTLAEQPAPELTEKQAAYLRLLVAMYRKQIRADDIPEAERHLLTTETAKRLVAEAKERQRLEWEAAQRERKKPPRLTQPEIEAALKRAEAGANELDFQLRAVFGQQELGL